MVAGKSFFFSKIGVQSCVRFRCTLLHSYFALHISETFTYKHPFGKENYVTNSLNFSTGKLVIASSLDTDIDYLVTLRNEMSELSGK